MMMCYCKVFTLLHWNVSQPRHFQDGVGLRTVQPATVVLLNAERFGRLRDLTAILFINLTCLGYGGRLLYHYCGAFRWHSTTLMGL